MMTTAAEQPTSSRRPVRRSARHRNGLVEGEKTEEPTTAATSDSEPAVSPKKTAASNAELEKTASSIEENLAQLVNVDNEVLSPKAKSKFINAKPETKKQKHMEKLHVPTVNNSVVYVPPEDQQPSTSGNLRRKRPNQTENGSVEPQIELPNDIPMEDRLRQITLKQQRSTSGKKSHFPKGGDDSSADFSASTSKQLTGEAETSVVGEDGKTEDSLVVLLTQALHSEDKAKLDIVFQKSDLRLIKSTIQLLPIELVIPLIRELQKRMRIKKDVRPLMRWLQSCLSLHMAYLTSIPGVEDELGGLHQWLLTRSSSLGRFLKLQGRLHLLVEQADRRKHPGEITARQPLLIFEESSSSDESDEEDEKMEASAASSEEEDYGTDLDEQWWNQEFPESGSGEEEGEDEEESETSSSEGEESDEEQERSSKKKRREDEEEGSEEGEGDPDQLGEEMEED